MKCSCLILEATEEFYTTLKPRKDLRFSVEVTSSWIIFPIVSPKWVWLFILFFFTKWDALCSSVVCVHNPFWAWMAISIRVELISLSNYKWEECILSFQSNHDNTGQIKAVFQGDTETRRRISEARLCTSSECSSEEAAEWYHRPLPVPNTVRTTMQNHYLEDKLLFQHLRYIKTKCNAENSV